MKFRLKPLSVVDKPLVFVWNEASGKVKGPGANLVRAMAVRAEASGYIAVHPIPSMIPCAENPLKNRTLLIALLSLQYELPDGLSDVEGDVESDDFDGTEITVDDTDLVF